MELKEFIEYALTDIVDGIVIAQEKASKKGAIIAPGSKTASTFIVGGSGFTTSKDIAHEISFEISVYEIEKDGSSKGLGVDLMRVTIGKNKQTQTESQSHNTIRFSIPVVYPSK